MVYFTTALYKLHGNDVITTSLIRRRTQQHESLTLLLAYHHTKITLDGAPLHCLRRRIVYSIVMGLRRQSRTLRLNGV